MPTTRGDGATAAGTTAVSCAAASCTIDVYAAINSNRPQPSNGQAAAQVGAGLVITKVATSGGNPSGGAETFQDAGQTPPNANEGNSPVVDIASRRPLGSNYPGPSDGVHVPVSSGITGNPISVGPGFYIVHGTVNFLHVTSS